MRSRQSKEKKIYVVLIVFVILLYVGSLYVGRYSGLRFGNVSKILIFAISGKGEVSWTQMEYAVIIFQRFPRVTASLLIGAALAISGAAYQALFANPMASADTLGVTNSASYGAVLAILLGWGAMGMKILAFVLGCTTVFGVYFIAKKMGGGRNTTLFLLLIGMVISSLFSALLSVLKVIADPENQLPQITYWLMGSISKVRINELYLYFPFFVGGIILLFLIRWRMNLMILSDYEAKAMGVNANFIRIVTIVGATILTSASTSLTGGVSWVGLIIPHIAKMVLGDDMRKVMPLSALMGACFLMIADDIARTVSINEIPISVVTSLMGAPIFFIILLKKRGVLKLEN